MKEIAAMQLFEFTTGTSADANVSFSRLDALQIMPILHNEKY
ncbi:MAG: hypothetical protein ACT4OK_22670 [Gemmobacter sp.]